MSFILTILFSVFVFCSDAQIIRANAYYTPLSQPLLLDVYTEAAAAYSLRKLRTAYTGNCIRLRRTGDNVEQDIGFVNNYIDTVALKNFIGSASGFITTWYDQAGSNNATQTTAANQPNIVTSGSIRYQNGFVTIFTTSVNTQDFLTASRVLTNDEFSIYGVAWLSSVQTSAILAQHTGVTDIGRTSFLATTGSNGSVFFNNGTSYSAVTTNTYATNTLSLFESESDNIGTTTIKINGSGTGTISGQTWTPLNTSTSFGAFGNSGSGLTGGFSEIIIYSTKQNNAAGIRSNINSFYGIY